MPGSRDGAATRHCWRRGAARATHNVRERDVGVDEGGVVPAGLPLLELGVVVHSESTPGLLRRRCCGYADARILLPPPHGQHPPGCTPASRNHLPTSTTRQHTAGAPGPARRRAGGRATSAGRAGRPVRASRAGQGAKLESEQHELPDRRDLSPGRARIGESRPPDWGSRDSDADAGSLLPSLLPSLPGLPSARSLSSFSVLTPPLVCCLASASRGFVARENKFFLFY